MDSDVFPVSHKAAKVWVLIGSLVLIIGLLPLSLGFLKQQ